MTSAPPLIAIMEGRRVRARRAARHRPREVTLHLAVADVLRRHCLPTWRWTHFPAGEARDIRTGAKLKRMGLAEGLVLLIRPARSAARGQIYIRNIDTEGAI